MKKLIFLSLCTMVIFNGCAKDKNKQKIIENTVNQSVTEAETEKTVEEVVKVNPEIEKLNRVLVSMTDRCKEAIPNGDPEEFLADLHRVLALESAFPQDDISLYYLNT